MSLNFNKYKKVASFMLLGLFASLFSFLSVKDKSNKTYSLEDRFFIGEKAMADVPNVTLGDSGPGPGPGDGDVGDGA